MKIMVFRINVDFLIIAIFIIALLLNVLKGVGGSNALNVFFYGLCGVLIVYKIKKNALKINKISLIALANIFFVLVLFVYSVFVLRTNFIASLTFTLQFLSFWIFLFLLIESKKNMQDQGSLINVVRIMFKISFAIILISLIERIVPVEILKRGINFVSIGKGMGVNALSSGLPVSYYFVESSIPIRRTGSIFFEPLTLGLFCGFVTTAYFEFSDCMKRLQIAIKGESVYKIISMFATVNTFVKSGLMFLFPIFMRKKLFLVLSFCAVVFIGFFSLNSISKLASVMMHVNGLVSGVSNTRETPWLGHGVGTAGFTSYNALSRAGQVDKYFDYNDPAKNGNESLIGIVSYQCGFLYLGFYLLSLLLIAKRLSKSCKYMSLSIVTFVFAGLFTESVLSVIFQFVFASFLALLYNLSQTCKYPNKSRYVF